MATYGKLIVQGVAVWISPDSTVTFMVPGNPKKPGYDPYRRYESYKGAKTVSEYYARGGTRADLRYDALQGFIRIDGRDLRPGGSR